MAKKSKAKARVFLTPKQKSEIVLQSKKGESVKELAAAYKVSQVTIYRILNKAPARNPRTVVTTEMADRILELRSDGMSMNKIATTMGLGQATVVRHLRKLCDPMKAKAATSKPVTKPVHMIHTDEGPQIPLVSKKGGDLMEGFKLTLGIAAILFLLMLGLDQAGML